MADLHTKVSGTPPQQDQILLFLHMFSLKSACVEVGAPPMRVGTPQWEILDLPLLVLLNKYLIEFKKLSKYEQHIDV